MTSTPERCRVATGLAHILETADKRLARQLIESSGSPLSSARGERTVQQALSKTIAAL